MANQRFSRKIFNICLVFVIIIAILFIAVMLMLNYDENGETNMPFSISKISIISKVNGEDVEDTENRWNISIIQNNDIYIYIEKNDDYSKQETIASVKIDNFNIKKVPNIGELVIYKPTMNSTALFQNADENIAQEIEFTGTTSTDMMNLEISNQGGLVCFRCANNNVGTYTSNEDTEINYDNLISKLNIQEEDLKATITFNITITLDSGKVFKAENVEIEIPNDNIVNEGTVGREYTNLEDVIFKRIEN